MKIKELQGKEVSRKAMIEKKSSINDKKRMIPFILISKDNAGERWCCGEVDYIEKLDVNGAKWDNLKTFFKDHRASVDSAIGRVENVRVENNELKADVYFGSTADAIEVFNKYKEGILTDVSIRYRVEAATIEERQGEPDVITITSFDIKEVSAVGIGFDKGATIGRSKNLNEGSIMKVKEIEAKVKKLEALQERSQEQEKELQDFKRALEDTKKQDDKEVAELQRQNELKDIALAYNVDNEILRSFLDDKTKDAKALMRAILDQRREEQKTVYARAKSEDNRGEMLRAMADGLLIRAGFSPKEKHKDADMFRGMSVQNIVRKVAGLGLEASEQDLVRAMTTSDFPLILANIQNKVLQDSFEKAPVTFREWTQAVDFKDFKPRTEVRTTGFNAKFKEVHELGKTEYIQAGEDGITWALKSYGARFAFTRQMLINDDLGALVELLSDLVEDVAIFQNRKVYELLQAKGEFKNYKWEDGKPIFDANHNNYNATGSVISTESIAQARTAMSRQTDKNGTKLRILPKHLIVPPELEVKALEILNSTAKIEATNNGVANPFKGAFNLISDVELDDAKAWYLAAAKKTIKVGYLQGTNRQPIVEEVKRDAMGIEYNLVFDFGLTVEDYRGLYKNKGE